MNSTIARRSAAIAVVVLFGLGGIAGAQTGASEGVADRAGAWHVGTEIDVLPYALGGAYGSVVVAHDGWRVRAVASQTQLPASWVKDGFRDQRTDAYALLVDRFVGAGRRESRGFWVGGGVEIWRNRIGRDGSSAQARYTNTMATIGGGYVWALSRHVYLNPWAAGHLVASGSRRVDVAGASYAQPRFTAEASVKLGLTF